ncbi:porin [Ligilactobacillus animalis]|nr:porin [Ligilactobacillus animalis]
MKRSVCFLLIGAFVLGVSGCSYHVTWGKNGVTVSFTPTKKASSVKDKKVSATTSHSSSAKHYTKTYTKEELDQITAELLAPYEQRGYTKEKSFTGTKTQYAKWEKDPTSPTARYADQAISVEQAKGTGNQFVYFCPAKHVAWAVIFTTDK